MRNLCILFLFAISLFGCSKTQIGYLKVENAAYAINTLDVYDLRNVTEEDDLYWENMTRIQHKSPWVSITLNGVLGTDPINYAIFDVKASEGGDAVLFKSEVSIQGGGRIIFPFAFKSPTGKYLISVEVINEGYRKVLKDAYTIIIH